MPTVIDLTSNFNPYALRPVSRRELRRRARNWRHPNRARNEPDPYRHEDRVNTVAKRRRRRKKRIHTKPHTARKLATLRSLR